MSKESKDKELAIKEQFAIMKPGNDVNALAVENLGGAGISKNDIKKVKVPSGGGVMWEVPTIDGPQYVEHLDAIIIHTGMTRAYFKTEYDGSKEPPDCSSLNAVIGNGDPGGKCLDCPMDEFGSSPNPKSDGKACSEMREVYFMRPNSVFPTLLRVPSMSLGNARTYLVDLTDAGLRKHHVVTRLSLEKATNKRGAEYSRVVFQKVDNIEDTEAIDQYEAMMRPILEEATKEIVAESSTGYSATDNDPMGVDDPMDDKPPETLKKAA